MAYRPYILPGTDPSIYLVGEQKILPETNFKEV